MSGRPSLWQSLRRKWRILLCDHDWQFDPPKSEAWTGYIESCSKCGAICQVPM